MQPERCDRFAPRRFFALADMWLHVHGAEDFRNREDSLIFSRKKVIAENLVCRSVGGDLGIIVS